MKAKTSSFSDSFLRRQDSWEEKIRHVPFYRPWCNLITSWTEMPLDLQLNTSVHRCHIMRSFPVVFFYSLFPPPRSTKGGCTIISKCIEGDSTFFCTLLPIFHSSHILLVASHLLFPLFSIQMCFQARSRNSFTPRLKQLIGAISATTSRGSKPEAERVKL